jgi:ATP-dependent DNA ligase
MVLEGIVSKRADAPYAPALNREEFVVIGWTDIEDARPRLGALLLAN